MKFHIAQKIDHPGEVNKARYMPQNPDLIATMCPDGRTLVFDRTKHSSTPSGTVNAQAELVGHGSEGFGLHWNPGVEGQVATGSSDKTVKIWCVRRTTVTSSADRRKAESYEGADTRIAEPQGH